QGARGGIAAHAAGAGAEQAPDRLAGDLAVEVPERAVQRVEAAVMEGDVVDDAEMPLEVARVAADEELGIVAEARHGIAGGDAGQPRVGLDPDEVDGEARARPAVPGRPEGRLEIDLVAAQRQAGDLHGVSSPLAASIFTASRVSTLGRGRCAVLARGRP